MSGDPNLATNISAFFEQDHVEIDQLVVSLMRDMRAASEKPGAAVGGLVERLEEIDRRLERHIIWEEEILFPAVEELEPHLREGPGDVMRAEHAEIRDYKQRSLTHLRDGEIALAIRELDAAVDVLIDHNEKEEQIYYPTADQLFEGEAARSLLDRVRATA